MAESEKYNNKKVYWLQAGLEYLDTTKLILELDIHMYVLSVPILYFQGRLMCRSPGCMREAHEGTQ